MSLPNVTPRRTTARPSTNRIILVVCALLLLAFAVRACAHHENANEKLARDVTLALQANDLATVQKYQNAETATHINHGIVGRLSDRLAPLGALKSVKETTPAGTPDREHEFDLTFASGKAHERMKLDPQDKIVHFSVDVTSGTKS